MKKSYPIKKVFIFTFKQISKHPFAILTYLICNVVAASEAVMLPYCTKNIINNAKLPIDQLISTTKIYTFIFISITILNALLARMYELVININTIPYIRKQSLNYGIDNLFKKSYQYLQKNMVGTLTSRMLDLGSCISEIIELIFNKILRIMITLIISIYMLYSVSHSCTLSIIIWAIFNLILYYFFIPKIITRAEKFSRNSNKISGFVIDALSNFASIKLFCNWDKEKLLLNSTISKAIEKEKKLEFYIFFLHCCITVAFILLQFFTIYWLIYQLKNNKITAGDFVLVLGITSNVCSMFWQFIKDISNLSKPISKAKRSLSIIYYGNEMKDLPTARPLKVHRGEIVFTNVSFGYENHSKKIFNNFNCYIKPNEKVGLVGHSGVGKSTFISLLMKIYNIDSGKITIDNVDIKEISQDSLYSNISIVNQDTSLFNRSIIDNIRYSKPEASESEVILAAKKAHAHSFITKMPEGYNYIVGDKGAKLSGGQRQRIAIARSFLRSSPILILDEATSQLDNITEKEIQESLYELMDGKTSIVIAHSISTLEKMDKIFVFNKGTVVEEGNYNELIAKKGLFYKLWDAKK